jgi:predicted porin
MNHKLQTVKPLSPRHNMAAPPVAKRAYTLDLMFAVPLLQRGCQNPSGVSMKQKALAVAVLSSLASVAMAQGSNPVTLYGRLNVNFESAKVEGGSARNRVADNNSRIGIRGKEDLGGGLSAIFQIESRVRPDDGTGGGLATRDTWVGFSGGWGTIKLGRETSPLYYATADSVGMHNHETGDSADAFYYSGAYAQLRNNNSVSYTSPKMGGLDVAVQYARPNDTAAGNAHLGVALNYSAGALHVGGGYIQTRKFANASQKDSGLVLEADINFGSFVLAGYVGRDKEGGAKRNIYRIAGMLPVGASEFHLNFGSAGKRGNVANSDARQYTLAYNYNLSKRTRVYTYYTKIDNKSAAGYNFDNESLGAPIGKDSSALAVGIRHNF